VLVVALDEGLTDVADGRGAAASWPVHEATTSRAEAAAAYSVHPLRDTVGPPGSRSWFVAVAGRAVDAGGRHHTTWPLLSATPSASS
jgi:hypothetical protein